MSRPNTSQTRRIYQGTPGNMTVTEFASPRKTPGIPSSARKTQSSPRASSPGRPLQRASQAPPRRPGQASPYIRAPSPQSRYRGSSPTPAQRQSSGSFMDEREKESVTARNQRKPQRESILEDKLSTLQYKQAQLEAETAQAKQDAENARLRCERMEREQEALQKERDTALVRAMEAEDAAKKAAEKDDTAELERLRDENAKQHQELVELRATLGRMTQEQNDLAATAPSGAAPAGADKASFKPKLLTAFDKADEDDTGFAPRLDLRKAVDTLVPSCPEAKELSDHIRGMDVMIMEKENFQILVDKWIAGEQLPSSFD